MREHLFYNTLMPDMPALSCKRCHSASIIKFGVYLGAQRYQCQDCGCVFLANGAPLRGRVPVSAASQAMDLFFSGQTIESIRTTLEDSQDIAVTVTALERIVYRFARKAVSLMDGLTPELHRRWLLEGDSIPGLDSACVLDVLDLHSGFLLASDIITPSYQSQAQESIVQKAFSLARSTPGQVLLGPGLCDNYLADARTRPLAGLPPVACSPKTLLPYFNLRAVRAGILGRRLNYHSLANLKLLCQGWRTHFHFQCRFSPSDWSPYHSWKDIIEA